MITSIYCLRIYELVLENNIIPFKIYEQNKLLLSVMNLSIAEMKKISF